MNINEISSIIDIIDQGQESNRTETPECSADDKNEDTETESKT